MGLLFEELKNFFHREGWNKIYWVAYSGGLDSHVLLHLAATIRTKYPLNIRAIHINHQLSPNARLWEEHCENVCKNLAIDFIKKNIDIPLLGANLEERARLGRYRLFAETMMQDDYLLTAHHLDDQAETLLLQLLRGSGIKGLSAMPACKVLGRGLHARPLLNFPREDLQQYAADHQLNWIEDESNHQPHFARNFLRHEVFPILKKRWPAVSQTFARTAKHCAETQALLMAMTSDDLQKLREEDEEKLSVKKLLQLDPRQQRQVLRLWFEKLNFTIPSTIKMLEIQTKLLLAKQDKNPMIQWGNIVLRRYRDYLYIMTKLPSFDKTPKHWDLQKPLQIPSIGVLNATLTQGQGLRFDIKKCEIRFRQGSERCYFTQSQCHRTLKNLFQEWNIPTWERDRIPLIFVDNQLVQVLGYFLDQRFSADHDDLGYVISISSNDPI